MFDEYEVDVISGVIEYPSDNLRVKCVLIEEIDDTVFETCKRLRESLLASKTGVGLSAPQIGERNRIIALNAGHPIYGIDHDLFVTMINPEIIESSNELSSYYEGCLSIPDAYGYVNRPSKILISYFSENGKQHSLEAESQNNPLFTACVQHEIDHLDGKLFIDHLSRIKREMVLKAYKKRMKASGS